MKNIVTFLAVQLVSLSVAASAFALTIPSGSVITSDGAVVPVAESENTSA